MECTRLLLVDDDERYLRTLESFLQVQSEFDVVGTHTRANDAVSDYSSLAPDVVVIDACMPEIDGIEATWRIVTENPGARVIVISAHEASEIRDRALKAGAVDFVPKSNVARDLPAAIRRAAEDRPNGDVAEPRESSTDRVRVEASSTEAISQKEASDPPAPPCEIAVTVTVSVRGGVGGGRW